MVDKQQLTGRSVTEVVDAQLAAYNRRDVDAYCALFAPEAFLSRINDGAPLCRGIDEIRLTYEARFHDNPHLRCQILSRTVLGAFVVDHEEVEAFEGRRVEVVAIYEVREALIRSVRLLWP